MQTHIPSHLQAHFRIRIQAHIRSRIKHHIQNCIEVLPRSYQDHTRTETAQTPGQPDLQDSPKCQD